MVLVAMIVTSTHKMFMSTYYLWVCCPHFDCSRQPLNEK